MSQLIRASYASRDAADAAVERLAAIGYGQDQVSVVMSKETRDRSYGEDSADGHHVINAAAGGGVIGAAMGAIIATASAGAVVATGGLAAPFVAGPLVAGLAGAVGGSAIGALVGAAGSDEERKAIESDINAGNIIVAVTAKDEDVLALNAALHPDDQPTRTNRLENGRAAFEPSEIDPALGRTL